MVYFVVSFVVYFVVYIVSLVQVYPLPLGVAYEDNVCACYFGTVSALFQQQDDHLEYLRYCHYLRNIYATEETHNNDH